MDLLQKRKGDSERWGLWFLSNSLLLFIFVSCQLWITLSLPADHACSCFHCCRDEFIGKMHEMNAKIRYIVLCFSFDDLFLIWCDHKVNCVCCYISSFSLHIAEFANLIPRFTTNSTYFLYIWESGIQGSTVMMLLYETFIRGYRKNSLIRCFIISPLLFPVSINLAFACFPKLVCEACFFIIMLI